MGYIDASSKGISPQVASVRQGASRLRGLRKMFCEGYAYVTKELTTKRQFTVPLSQVFIALILMAFNRRVSNQIVMWIDAIKFSCCADKIAACWSCC